MKKQLTMMLLCLFVSPVATAGVPSFVTYSGRLTDGTGWGQTESIALTLALYDAETDGTKLWEQSFPEVVIQDGYFSVVLGDGTDPGTGQGLNVTVVFAAHDATWVSVAVGQGLELEPWQPVGSVPYAVRSERVGNPHCASSPCSNSDIIKQVVQVSVPSGETKVLVVRCPVEYPVPLSGGCTSNGQNMHLLGTSPQEWETPESWESGNSSKRAGWYCSADNQDGAAKTLTSYIICRRK